MKCIHCGKLIHRLQTEPFSRWVHTTTARMFCGPSPTNVATAPELTPERPARSSRSDVPLGGY